MRGLNVSGGLRSGVFGRKIFHHDVVDSTNSRALDLIRKGAEEGTVIIAEEQIAGRGRQGRTWYSEKGKNLLFSVIIRSISSEEMNGLLSLTSALSVASAVRNLYAISVECKWPNDLNINGKKFCGILLESVRESNQFLGISVGVGINVNQMKFPPEIATKAVSLSMSVGKNLDRHEILEEVLMEMERNFSRLKKGFGKDILKEWKVLSPHIGHNISLKMGKDILIGIMEDIAEDGALVMRQGNKKIKLYSGDISYVDCI